MLRLRSATVPAASTAMSLCNLRVLVSMATLPTHRCLRMRFLFVSTDLCSASAALSNLLAYFSAYLTVNHLATCYTSPSLRGVEETFTLLETFYIKNYICHSGRTKKINDTAKRGATLVNHGNLLPIYILADDE